MLSCSSFGVTYFRIKRRFSIHRVNMCLTIFVRWLKSITLWRWTCAGWNHSAHEIWNGLDPGPVGTHRIGTAAAKLDERSRRHGAGKI